jgi:hypothetical protein
VGDLGQARVWRRDGYVDADGRNSRIMWAKNYVKSFVKYMAHGKEQAESYVTAAAREHKKYGVAYGTYNGS